MANNSIIEAVAALSDLGQLRRCRHRGINSIADVARQAATQREPRSPTLSKHLRDGAAGQGAPAGGKRPWSAVYSYDIDFQRKVQPGSGFDVFYAGDDEGTPTTEKNEVPYASLTVGGETKKYYRFQTPDDAAVDFMTRPARARRSSWSANRSPARSCDQDSAFRRHPILGFVKNAHARRLGGGLWHTHFRDRQQHSRKSNSMGEQLRQVLSTIKHNNGYETAWDMWPSPRASNRATASGKGR